MKSGNKKIKFVFFGTSEFSVHILEELKKAGLVPELLVTTPDSPKGRKLVLTPPLTKVWAEDNRVKVLQELDAGSLKGDWDVFVVASYGKIIPKEILNIPKFGSLNVHPSLLPELRGPSPLQEMILRDMKETGVTIILMDEEMDHGPILDQEFVTIEEWPKLSVLEEKLARVGAKLLIRVMPEWIAGNIDEQEQDHAKAIYVQKIEKKDAEINLEDNSYLNFRKVMAYERLKPYFFKDNKRIIINEVELKGGALKILRVTPEGRKEIDYSLL